VRCPGRCPKRPQATLGYSTGGHENQGIHGREAGFGRGRLSGVISELCDPFLSHVYRLDGILDLGDVMIGNRRVVPLADRMSTEPRSMATRGWPAARPGRSSCGRHGASRKFVTRCRPTAALCSASNQGVLATAIPGWSRGELT
jgi:hypothetical protein